MRIEIDVPDSVITKLEKKFPPGFKSVELIETWLRSNQGIQVELENIVLEKIKNTSADRIFEEISGDALELLALETLRFSGMDLYLDSARGKLSLWKIEHIENVVVDILRNLLLDDTPDDGSLTEEEISLFLLGTERFSTNYIKCWTVLAVDETQSGAELDCLVIHLRRRLFIKLTALVADSEYETVIDYLKSRILETL